MSTDTTRMTGSGGAPLTREDVERLLHEAGSSVRLDLHEVTLMGADLSGLVLQGANLALADLTWTNLRGADLREALLGRATLGKADLGKADLSRAHLTGVNQDVSPLVETCIKNATPLQPIQQPGKAQTAKRSCPTCMSRSRGADILYNCLQGRQYCGQLRMLLARVCL